MTSALLIHYYILPLLNSIFCENALFYVATLAQKQLSTET